MVNSFQLLTIFAKVSIPDICQGSEYVSNYQGKFILEMLLRYSDLLLQEKTLITQPAFTCSKLTIETLQQLWNMFKVKNKDTRTTPFAPCSSIPIVNFEQVNAGVTRN